MQFSKASRRSSVLSVAMLFSFLPGLESCEWLAYRQVAGPPPAGAKDLLLATGVLVSDGLILTVDHGVSACRVLRVSSADGRIRAENATVVSTSPADDLALVKVEYKGEPSVRWRDVWPKSDREARLNGVVDGTFALIGYPRSAGPGVKPIVTPIKRVLLGFGTQTQARRLVILGDVQPGDSGGPVVDASGRVIGMNFRGATPAERQSSALGKDGLGLAVPEVTISRLLSRAGVEPTGGSGPEPEITAQVPGGQSVVRVFCYT